MLSQKKKTPKQLQKNKVKNSVNGQQNYIRVEIINNA